MEDTSNIVEQLESGEYQRQQILIFENWAARNGHSKKEIAQVQRDLLNRVGIYYDTAPGEAALRQQIMLLMALNETRGAAILLEKAIELIIRQQEYIGGPYLSKFEMAVALRMRFTLDWSN